MEFWKDVLIGEKCYKIKKITNNGADLRNLTFI